MSVGLLDLVGGHGSCGSTSDRSNIVSRCGSRSRLTYLPLCDPHTPGLTLRLIGIWDLKSFAFEKVCMHAVKRSVKLVLGKAISSMDHQHCIVH